MGAPRDNTGRVTARDTGWQRGALATIALLFLALRVLPVASGGSFIDEYLHLFSGQSILAGDGPARFYRGEHYLRGLHMSLWSGAWMAALGPKLWVARLAPLSLACVGLWLMYRIAWRALATAVARLTALGLYALGPLVVFNHFYIRMYVVYEVALLGMLLGAMRAGDALRTGKPRVAFRPLLAATCTGATLALTSHDPGVAMPLLGAALALAYLFVVELGPASSDGDDTPPPWYARPRAKLALLLAGGALAAWLFDPARQLGYLLSAELYFTSAEDLKYVALFLHERPLTTLLFAGGVGWAAARGDGAQRMLCLVGFGLLGVHLVSSEDLQLRRGIAYLMPIYYLIAALSIDRIALAPSGVRALTLPLALLALGGTAASLPAGFFRAPGIPSEVSYIDYGALYGAVRRQCAGHLVVDASPSPHIGGFYGVRPDYVVFRPSGSRQDRMVRSVGAGADGTSTGLATVFGALPAVVSPRQLPRDGRPVCLIVRRPSAHRFLSKGLRMRLERVGRPLRFAHITLYRLAPGTLSSRRRF